MMLSLRRWLREEVDEECWCKSCPPAEGGAYWVLL